MVRSRTNGHSDLAGTGHYECFGARVACAVWLVVVAGADAVAQKVPGKVATVPTPPELPRSFRLDFQGAKRYLLRDGEAQNPDSPYVLAVAGGAKLWFDDYYLTAQNILVWLEPTALGDANASERADDFPYGVESPLEPRDAAQDRFASVQDPSGLPPFVSTGRLRELYAEGDVYIQQGEARTFQAEKAYFNVLENRSLIVQGEIRTDLAGLSLAETSAESSPAASKDGDVRSVPIVIRAAEIRGVSNGLWEAQNARVTTSSFAKPGYHIAMDRLVYEDRAVELGGRVSGYGNQFVLGDVPLLTLPYFSIRTGTQSPLPLIGLSTGASSQFGLFLETRWGSVFEDAGNQFNQALGVDGDFSGLWFADVNLYSKRGLGLGGGVEYETKDGERRKYFGRTEFFVIHDFSGDDETARGKRENFEGLRGYFQTQNRFFLPDDWQLDTEIYYVSDRDFLKEFKEDKFKEEKAPETYAYLKKTVGDTEVSALVRARINDWQSQTSYLPQFTYDVVSRPIAEFESFGDALGMSEPARLYWDHRSEVGFVNRKLGDFENKRDRSGTAFRIDDVERLRLPFDVGSFGFDPYVENRVTLWAGDGDRDGSDEAREAMTIGFNANTQFWRTDADYESELWNIHGIRHLVIPTLRYRWTFLSTVDSQDLIPYDRVESFDKLHILVPGIRSRYQTKRMTANGVETVTFLDFDVQQPLIISTDRGDQDFLGDLHVEAKWRPDMEPYLLRNSTLGVSTDLNWNDAEVDRFKIEFHTEPGQDFYSRVAYSWAQRGRVSPTLALEGFAPKDQKNDNLSSLTFEFGYQATRLWEFVVLKQFDFGGEGSGGGENRLIVRRRTADWMFEFGLGASGAGTGIGITVTPIALFKRPERDRFQTALSDNYDLTPIFEEPVYASGPVFGANEP